VRALREVRAVVQIRHDDCFVEILEVSEALAAGETLALQHSSFVVLELDEAQSAVAHVGVGAAQDG